jgi:NTE family protein
LPEKRLMDNDYALVLAGGGSLGAVQVGMLQALMDEQVGIERVVGASVGAINGAYFACHPNAEGVAQLAQIWCGLGARDIFPFSLFGAAASLWRNSGHLLDNARLSALLHRLLPVERLEDCELPLHIVTTDALSGAEVVRSQGKLLDALLASAAIPLVYPPVEIDGRLLMDGGVASNTPIATAVAMGSRRILVLPTGFGCACKTPPSGFVALALHTINLMGMRQLLRDIELHGQHAQIHVAAPLCPLGVSVFDFTQTPRLIERARRQTREWMAAGGLEQTQIPDALRAHAHPDMHMSH